MSSAEPVQPYRGDADDLVGRLEWVKSHVMCVKPGRELVWAEFDEVIDLVKLVLDVNESLRQGR